MQRLKGSAALLFDAVEQITNLVERTHGSVTAKVVSPLMALEPTATVTKPVSAVHDITAGGVYKTIRGVNRGLANVFDLGFELLQRELPGTRTDTLSTQEAGQLSAAASNKSRLIDHAESALNAMYGDFLNHRKNALDIGMSFRLSGTVLPIERDILHGKIPDATGKIVIFIHGLACNEGTWNISAEEFYGDPAINFGSMLKDGLGYTPLYVRYNSGRHISENGQLLSALLAQLVAEYPRKVEEIMLVGHSMGGLVARSATHYGASNNAAWIQQLSHIFCLGSPNLGAPLEKGVNLLSSLLGAFNTAGTQVPAEILNTRSAGIKDLRFGYTIDEEWADRDPDGCLQDHRQHVPLIEGVRCYFIAATFTNNPGHPAGRLLGDMLVCVPSAAGHAAERSRNVLFDSGQILSGMGHLHIANHPEVYQVIRQIL